MSLAAAVIVSIAIAAALTMVVLVIVLSVLATQVEPSGPGDDMSGLWVVVVGGLILITVGPLSLATAFAVVSHRLQVPSRGRWAAVVGAALLVVAAVAAVPLRTFLRDRGVGILTWVVVTALVAVAVATARIVTRYSLGRNEQVVVAAGLAMVLVSVGVGWLNSDRHARAVSYGIIEQRDVTLALPPEDATWVTVDMSSPAGYRARDSLLTATLRDSGGREVLLDPLDDRHEPCYEECVEVATMADDRVVRTKSTAYGSWYVVAAGVGHWAIRSDEQITPDDAADLFEQLRAVTIDEWLDTDRSLDDNGR